MNKRTHDHLDIGNHTVNQQKMFFGLASSMGYNAEEVKQRACERFNVDCFNKLTVLNLVELIDRLVQHQQRIELQKIRKRFIADEKIK